MIFFIILIVLMLLVIAYDATRYIIPNWLSGILLVLYPYLVLTVPGLDWKTAYLGMGVVFALGFAIYALKWMGAGDIKLLAVLAPFVAGGGWGVLGQYVVYVTLAGGALSVFLLLARKAIPWVIALPQDTAKARLWRVGSPVPYGLAIAGVFIAYLWLGKIPGVVV